MIKFILIFILPLLLFSQELSISSDFFEADENKKVSQFTGNVSIEKGKDTLTALQLIVQFNDAKKPISYKAIGNVKFKVFLNNKYYTGSANMLSYDALKEQYTLKSDAKLEELNSSNSIQGNIIMIDQKNDIYQVIGSDRSKATFVFQIDSNKSIIQEK